MFMGMTLVLPMHAGFQRCKKKEDGYAELDGGEAKPSLWQSAVMISVPAIFDLMASLLCFIGLLYNNASVWQMLRGSMIIFSALLSVAFLNRKLKGFHWLGVTLACCAILIIGFANLKTSEATAGSPSSVPPVMVAFGMGCILLGQVVQASQIVAEERLLQDIDLHPFLIVGFEGMWGVIGMAVLYAILPYIPGNDNGKMEDMGDTVVMIENNTQLVKVIGVYIFSVFTYNIVGMYVTASLSAVHRSMLEASRTAIIWAIDLTINYTTSGNDFGEKWVNPWSFVQLGGFVLLVLGQSIYSQILIVPGFTYPFTPLQTPASPAAVFHLPGDLPPTDAEWTLACTPKGGPLEGGDVEKTIL
mmetsp:Transcript_2785/g.6407  ORF Transcript_2785/g.6407 Transcript_2785/m.6407 type:complete len:359 (+) Transcript_2785:210-1286(+)